MKQGLERSTNFFSLIHRRGYIPFLVLWLSLFGVFACVRRSRAPQQANEEQSTSARASAPVQNASPRVNINTASANELETLPGIGKGLAERIIEHREKYGPFRRPEHLIIVRGISDHKFRALRDLITVE